jgi:hypothetical protein
LSMAAALSSATKRDAKAMQTMKAFIFGWMMLEVRTEQRL